MCAVQGLTLFHQFRRLGELFFPAQFEYPRFSTRSQTIPLDYQIHSRIGSSWWQGTVRAAIKHTTLGRHLRLYYNVLLQ